PPNAVWMYQVFGDFGSIAMSWTRPVWMAGPMLRNSSPLRTSAVSRSALPAGAWCAIVLSVAERARAAIAAPNVLDVMGRDSVRIRLRGQLSGWIDEAFFHRGLAGRHVRGVSRVVRAPCQAGVATGSTGRRAAGAGAGSARGRPAPHRDRSGEGGPAGSPQRRGVLGTLAEPVRAGGQLPIRQPAVQRGVPP